MLEFPGYRAIEVTYEGRSVVARAIRMDDGSPAILKTTLNPRPTPGEVARLRRDFLVSSLETLRSWLRAKSFEWTGERPVVVFEPFAGVPCSSMLDLETSSVVDIAFGAGRALLELHSERIAHGALEGSHILYDPHTRQVKLCGLGEATLSVRRAPLVHFDEDSTSFDRWSGRARELDEDGDLLALGAILQALVQGKRWTAKISETGFELVLSRLLAVDPAQRFPHALALWQALQVLEHDGPAHGEAPRYAPLPPFIYRSARRIRGRTPVLERLEDGLERARGGRPGWIALSGAEGAGKSAVLAALEHRWSVKDATVVRCEFPPEASSRPYYLHAHAFPGLLRRWAADRPETLWQWRERFSAALGVDAALLVERLPTLRFLLGEVSAGNRPLSREPRWGIVHCLVEFTRLFARQDRPLVLLLDDWDNADPQSRAVVRRLLALPGKPFVLVVSTHERCDSRPSPESTSLDLEPLAEQDIIAIVNDMVPGLDPSVAASFGARTFSAVGGVPLAVHDVVWWAATRGVRSSETPSSEGWSANLDQLVGRLEDAARGALVDDRLRDLSEDALVLLGMAACLGRQFDVAMLTVLSRKASSVVFRAIAMASERGLVVAEGPDLGRWGLNADEPGLSPMARFIHEDIRRRVLATASAEDIAQWHWKIGQFVLQTTGRDALRDRKFEIAHHLNRSAGVAVETEQRLQVARLDLVVARANRELEDYTNGLRAAKAGLARLPEDPWRQCRDVAYDLTLEWCRCSALGGVPRDEIFARCQALVGHARNELERLSVLEVRVRFLVQNGESERALAEACEGLPEFAVPSAPEHVEAFVAERWRRLHGVLAGTDVSRLVLQVEDLEDALARCMESIIVAALHAGWSHGLSRAHALALSLVERALAGYSVPLTGLECVFAGVVAMHGLGEAELGYRLVRAGVARARSRGRWQGSTRLMATVADWVRRPLRYVETATMRALQEFEKVEWDQLGETLVLHCAANLVQGAASLVQASRSLEWLRSLARRAGIEHVAGLQAATTFVKTLTVEPVGMRLEWPCAVSERANALTALWNSVLGCQAAVVLGDPAGAVAQAARAQPHRHVAFGWPMHLNLRVYDALAWAGWEDKPREERQERVAEALQRVAHWSTFVVAENIASAQALLTAELARLRGEDDDAERAYDVAIADAHDRGSHLDHALATEFSARFHQGSQSDRTALERCRQALRAYEGWGATRKVAQLEQQFGNLDHGSGTAETKTQGPGETAVVEALMRWSDALRVIAEAKGPGEVAATLLAVVVELSEAQRGVVLRMSDGEPQVMDAYPSEAFEGSVPGPVRGLNPPLDPGALWRVATKVEPLVIDLEDSSSAPQSGSRILCIPLSQGGTTIGLFVLQGDPDTLRLMDRLPWLALVVVHGARTMTEDGGSGGTCPPDDESRRIQQALLETGGSLVKAARILGTTRGALSRRMKSLGIPTTRKGRKP